LDEVLEVFHIGGFKWLAQRRVMNGQKL